ncbi:glycosyl hydrolase catalytic core-domain-containing protein [Triangularia verruculosa]|uniref:Glycosyl hydrolase catalytic core-domain-containing protein n=1 Tax=Triangularia verruculosa TaxID=2587418 RepID=A0AAN6XLX4_9PEZI|nr:glycosyl hydrolase catalytic core-domain-containing protein [Triangularia verruculosa]
MLRFSHVVIPALLLSLALGQTEPAKKNPKRGLVSTPSEFFPKDDLIWSNSSSPLSWYWNFGPVATKAYADIPQSEFEFVPSMWGAYTPNGTDSYFLGNLTAEFSKFKPAHVISFNLPDQPFEETGGSDMSPEIAARTWINNIMPLREEHGIKVGFPTVSDPRGGWVEPFMKNCSKMNDGNECEFDFVPLHSFGGFGTLKDNIGKWQSRYVFLFQ